MKVHEYQAKKLFLMYGVETTCGITTASHKRAGEAAAKLGGDGFVVKAQVHSGGRGKAGGVKFGKTPAEVEEIAKKMLGSTLYTNQSGAEGKLVRKVLVETATNIVKEFYLSLTIDNENACVMLIGSGEGGTEIEEVAAHSPENIIKVRVPFETGVRPFHSMYLAKMMGIPKEQRGKFVEMVATLYRMFFLEDFSLIEINPLVITDKGELIALDAKMNFDDNALHRHERIIGLRDKREENAKEVEAAKHDLNYIQLDGDIGCMVNGAGLAMATMDIIEGYGGKAANFLDVGGSANVERVTAAFRLLLSDPNVRVIMVNIFGGIMKCDVIAQGIIEAAEIVKPSVPIVVRLDGTNVEKGKQILRNSALAINSASTMAEAAQLSINLAK